MQPSIRLCAFADEASADRQGQIQALLDNCIPYLEIRGVDGVNIGDIDDEAARRFKSELDAAGIRVWSVGSPAGKSPITEDFAIARAKFARLLELSNLFGATCIRLFSFYGTDGDPAYFDEVTRRLNIFCDMAEAAGVIPCHENEKGIYGDTAERCLQIHRAVPRLRAVFDPANFIQCGEDVPTAWAMLAPYVYYGHIKDALPDGRIVPPGDGVGHIADYLPDFVARGCSVLTLEPHLAEFVGLAALEGEGDRSEIGTVHFDTPRAAFDHAVIKLKEILAEKESRS